MPPVALDETPATEENREEHVKPVIGIIYPPPEVRNIVDKTASFVARNGPEFETRIRQNEINNPKFNFLNPQDPYNAYYQHKVKEFKEGRGQEPSAPKGPPSMAMAPHQKIQEKIIEPIIPKEPPPEFEFLADPPSISAYDLDVVRLTAQFVARNGRQFLTNLMNREQRNFQFDFLRPQHSLFNYFTKLVEQYTKILIPPKDLLPKLRKEGDDPKVVQEQVKYRVDWIRYQEREKQREAEKKERERVAYASIDWHDFVVVETVDFQYNETGNLPPPTTPEEVGARVIAQERYHERPVDHESVEMEVASSDSEDEGPRAPSPRAITLAPDDTQVRDMEEDSDDDDDGGKDGPPTAGGMPPPPPPPPSEHLQPPPLPPTPDNVVIKKDYNPKAPKSGETDSDTDKFLVSPITGEKIPAERIQEHMRISLLDPKWLEQQGRSSHDKRDTEEVYAPGSSVGSSLQQLAARRTDIFGVGLEETQIGKKIGEEETRDKNKFIWDGHTASMEKVTQKARENISIEEQIAVIHKAKGLVADDEKEKIGPAMPKGGGNSSVPAPPQPPILLKTPSGPLPKPPLPAPVTPKNQPPSKPILPPPPRPPVGPSGGGPRPPIRPPMMMMGQGPPQPPMGQGPMLARPPMPPMMGLPPRQPGGNFMPRPPMGGPPGMLPPPGMGGRPQGPPGGPKHPGPSGGDDEPPNKKMKTEESLMPEAEFLAKNKGPVTFKVQVPKNSDKADWNLAGQVLSMTLPLTDNVSVIKAKLHEALGMPAGKQKLQLEGLFIKDSNTLAFYNFTRNCSVHLQLKERGGRKK